MELYELREIAKKNNEASQLIVQFFRDERFIENMDEYISKRNSDLIGKADLEPDENLPYWLGIIFCRAVKNEFDPTSKTVIQRLSNPEILKTAIDAEYHSSASEISKLINGIAGNEGFSEFIDNRRSITTGNTKWKSGDLFAVPIEDGTHITGRVLCKISDCLKGKKADGRTNGLVGAKNCFLVQTFEGLVNEPIIGLENVVLNGVLVYPDALTNGFWLKIGEKPVVLDEIDFPEYIYLDGMDENGNKQAEFMKGEMVIPIPYNDVLYEVETNWQEIILDSYRIDGFTSYQMGDVDKIAYYVETHDLRKIDLRYNSPELRRKIYELAGLNPDASYRELAESRGVDLNNYLK